MLTSSVTASSAFVNASAAAGHVLRRSFDIGVRVLNRVANAATSSAAHRTVVCRHRWRAYRNSERTRGPRPLRSDPFRRRCRLRIRFRDTVCSRPFDARLTALAFRNTRVGLSFPVPAAADRAHVICPFRVVVISIIERGRMIGIGGDDDSSRSVEQKTRARRCSMIIFFISS